MSDEIACGARARVRAHLTEKAALELRPEGKKEPQGTWKDCSWLRAKSRGPENSRVAGAAGPTWGRKQGQRNVGTSYGAAGILGSWLGLPRGELCGLTEEGGWRGLVLRRSGLSRPLQGADRIC